MKPVVIVLVTLLGLFMVGTVFIAVFQDSIGWGWWWTLPVGAGFVAAILGFRVLVQKLDEQARRQDAELDALEQARNLEG